MKLTRVEYMKKIGFVEGINYRIALTKQYKEYLEIIGDIEEGVIEIKKEWVYQQGYRSKVLVVYSVLSQSEKVDYQLMNNSLQDSDYTKYVSFKNIDPKVQLGMLYSNNLVEVKEKYEVLEGVSVINVAIIQRKIYWLRDYLLRVKVNNIRLFAAVE